MPTGYTEAIKDGISFKDFVMKCTRAMGVCITMRDAPNSAPIPKKFEPSIYNKRCLAKTRDRLNKLKAMSVGDAVIAAKKEYDDEVVYNEKMVAHKIELKKKYLKMLSFAEEWVPPTSEHLGLKKFMVDQIKKSIDFDCDTEYYINNPPKLKTGEEWLSDKIAKAMKDINYHEAEDLKEIERVKGRNDWLAKLRESLEDIDY